MIIGSGLLVKSFANYYEQKKNVAGYATGISNSSCRNEKEYRTERKRI